MDLNAKKTIVSVGQVIDLLSSNRFKHTLLNGNTSAIQNFFVLPPDTKMSVSRSADFPSVRIDIINPNLKTSITILFSQSMVLQRGIPKVLEPDPQDMDRYESFTFLVDLEANTLFARAFFPGVEDYKRWFEQVCRHLEVYSWATIDASLSS